LCGTLLPRLQGPRWRQATIWRFRIVRTGGTGRISKSHADDHALGEFQKYRITQDRLYISDFDRLEGKAEVGE